MTGQQDLSKTAGTWISNLAGLIIIIPLTPFICRFIPPVLLGEVPVDLVAAFLLAVFIVRAILWLMRPLIFPALLLVVGYLTYAQYAGTYGFQKVWHDYKTLTFSNWQVKNQKSDDLLSLNPGLLEKPADKVTRRVKSKMQLGDSALRNWAVQHALLHFTDYEKRYGNTVRVLSLFKHINENFKYVSDIKRDEYYATPLETIANGMGGDCDDHSILMAGALMHIGAKCRIIIVDGHMYPELFVGSKEAFLVMQQAIIQCFKQYSIHALHYHEHEGQYWMNLDYTARYPGGPYDNNNLRLIIEF